MQTAAVTSIARSSASSSMLYATVMTLNCRSKRLQQSGGTTIWTTAACVHTTSGFGSLSGMDLRRAARASSTPSASGTRTRAGSSSGPSSWPLSAPSGLRLRGSWWRRSSTRWMLTARARSHSPSSTSRFAKVRRPGWRGTSPPAAWRLQRMPPSSSGTPYAARSFHSSPVTSTPSPPRRLPRRPSQRRCSHAPPGSTPPSPRGHRRPLHPRGPRPSRPVSGCSAASPSTRPAVRPANTIGTRP